MYTTKKRESKYLKPTLRADETHKEGGNCKPSEFILGLLFGALAATGVWSLICYAIWSCNS